MAKFDAKSFNEKAFGKYMSAIPNVKLNKLRESRAIVGDARLRNTFVNNSQTGTVYAVLPFFGLLSGTPQNYDGVDNVTPDRTDTFEQGVFTYGRMNGWTEADFSYDITGGTDFMANVRSQINDYWNSVDQDVILAILKGVFGMKDTGTGDIKKSNAAFVEAHTYDIAQAGAEHTDDTMKMDATTLNSAIQKACGDNKQKFKLVYCHSAVATNLENLKLLAYLKYTDAQGIERDLEMGTWNGRLVIIDDSLPTKVVEAVAEDTGKGIKAQDAYTEYTTYILGEGAIGFEDVGAKVPYEMVRDAKTTAELVNMVYAAAQDARGSFSQMADVVARFGNNAKDAFSSSEEVVAFADLIQKQMTIAGASTQEAANAELQLSQALGSGVLRGDELNSIFEQAPNLIQNIADYLDVPIGKIREMAADGELSADVVKAAIFSAADDINSKFNEMPMTWGQMWQSMQNTALIAFQPVLQRLNDLANSEAFQTFIQGAIEAMATLDLYGEPVTWVCPELERRISEALAIDERITGVTDFEFDLTVKGVVHAYFTVKTIYGDIKAEKGVKI